MKKLKEKRMKRIALMAFGILALIVTICLFINPVAAIGVPAMAFALTIGNIELTPEQEKFYNEMMGQIIKEIEKREKGYFSGTHCDELIKAHLKEFTDKFGEGELIKELQKQLDTLGTEINSIKEKGGMKQESKFTTGVKSLIKNFTEKVKGNRSEGFAEIEMENKTAATTIGVANVDVDNIPYINAVEVQQGVIPDVLPQQTIMSLVTVQPISKASLAWTERKALNGNATWIAEGTIKALQDYTWETFVEAAKKIASRTKFSEEAIDDIDFMQGEIYALQGRDLDRQMATAVLSATKSSTSIGGITTMASSYTITALNDTITEPTLYDVLNAMNAQCVALGFVGRKSAVINPYDWAIAKSQKDTTGRYDNIAAMIRAEYNVVEDPEVTAGYVLFGELSYFTVKMYKQKGIRLGYSSEDWEKNLMSAIAENRLLTMLPDNYKGAIIYDAISTVKAAIAIELA